MAIGCYFIVNFELVISCFGGVAVVVVFVIVVVVAVLLKSGEWVSVDFIGLFFVSEFHYFPHVVQKELQDG